MIRSAHTHDTAVVVTLAVSSGLFTQQESGGVGDLMEDYFTRTCAQGHACVLDVDGDGLPVGVAYYQPVPATDRTWTLLMIAVRRDRQGQGRGGALLRRVEEDLRHRQQRLLLVETSGLPGFSLTRKFYDRAGYRPEARVRDYYQAGDDMVLFRKDLTATKPGTTGRPGSNRSRA